MRLQGATCSGLDGLIGRGIFWVRQVTAALCGNKVCAQQHIAMGHGEQ